VGFPKEVLQPMNRCGANRFCGDYLSPRCRFWCVKWRLQRSRRAGALLVCCIHRFALKVMGFASRRNLAKYYSLGLLLSAAPLCQWTASDHHFLLVLAQRFTSGVQLVGRPGVRATLLPSGSWKQSNLGTSSALNNYLNSSQLIVY